MAKDDFKKQIDKICLGTMYFGTGVDKKTSFELLDLYHDNGGYFIDTANIYFKGLPGFKGGESETVLGEWIKKKKNRDKLFIATKVGGGYQDTPTGLKKEIIIKECDRSLKRLGIDVIDLYYSHVDDRNTPLEETLEAFNMLIKQGKVHYLGTSNQSIWRMEEANCVCKKYNLTGFYCLQNHFTYLKARGGTTYKNHVPGRASEITLEAIDYCRVNDITMLSYSPLLQGAYVKKDRKFHYIYRDGDNLERLKRLNKVAEDLGVTSNQVVLAWMMQQDPPVIPLITASRVEHLRENIDAVNLALSETQLEYLDIHNDYKKGKVN